MEGGGLKEVDAYLRDYVCMVDKKQSPSEYNKLLELAMRRLNISTEGQDLIGEEVAVLP